MNENNENDELFEYTFNIYQECAKLLISNEEEGRDKLIEILEKKITIRVN